MSEQKKVTLQPLYPNTLDPSITTGNVERSKVYEPQWINNQTRLNSHNVELMRANLIKYINNVLQSFDKQTTVRLNNIHKNSAGWIVFDDTDNALGEVFNDYENNSVNTEKQYQAVFGHCNIANGDAQFVCGKFNEEVADALLIVGCGKGETDPYVEYIKSFDPELTYYVKQNDTYIQQPNLTQFEEGTTYYVLAERRNALVIDFEGKTHFLNDVKLEQFSSLEVGGDLIVSGTVNFCGDLSVDGTVTVGGTLDVYDSGTIHKKLTVKGRPTAKQHVVRKQELDELRQEISGALHYIGIVQDSDRPSTTIGYHNPTIPLITVEADNTIHTQNVPVNGGDVILIGEVKTDADGVNYIEPTLNEYIFTVTDTTSGITGYWSDYSRSSNYVLTYNYEADKETTKEYIDTADKRINKAAFGTDDTPSLIDDESEHIRDHSLKKRIMDEITNREHDVLALNYASFGQQNTPETSDLIDPDTREPLYPDKPKSLQRQIRDLTYNVFSQPNIPVLQYNTDDPSSYPISTQLRNIRNDIAYNYMYIDGGNAFLAMLESEGTDPLSQITVLYDEVRRILDGNYYDDLHTQSQNEIVDIFNDITRIVNYSSYDIYTNITKINTTNTEGVLIGDIDGNGKVNARDLSYLYRYLVNIKGTKEKDSLNFSAAILEEGRTEPNIIDYATLIKYINSDYYS